MKTLDHDPACTHHMRFKYQSLLSHLIQKIYTRFKFSKTNKTKSKTNLSSEVLVLNKRFIMRSLYVKYQSPTPLVQKIIDKDNILENKVKVQTRNY
jgi:hypothetical protein